MLGYSHSVGRVPLSKQIDLRSFLLVVAAFIGNAQIKGIDITLAVLFPALLLLLVMHSTRVTQGAALLYTVFLLIMAVMTYRAATIGIPYFDAYWLWPLKAALLTGFAIVIIPHARWPAGNHLMLFGLCMLMLVFARFEYGRMYSLFGPNMLYRLFGIFLVLSAVLFHKDQTLPRPVLLLFFGIGLALSLATGSSGSILIILLGFAIMFWRLGKRNRILIVVAGITFILMISLVLSNTEILANIEQLRWAVDRLEAVSRLFYKIQTIGTIDRFIGWQSILANPISLLGRDYSMFNGIWFFGYEYPHNLFVELLAFYGYLGLVFIIVIVVTAMLRPLPSNAISATFMVILLGSMLSGDLSDNFGAIVLAVAPALLFFSGKHRRTENDVMPRTVSTKFSKQRGAT